MTIHEPGSPTHAWRCTVPGCTGPRSCGAGYPSQSAAVHAEARHTDKTHPATGANGGTR